MKNSKYITINGVDFKLRSKTVKRGNITQFHELVMCYSNPSDTKIEKYVYWDKFFSECGSRWYEHGIVSYNTFMFTYAGYVTYENVDYYLKVTKTKQEAYICK